jgi:hypothetical protein
VFNATFNHISITMSVLLVKETEVPGENHRPAASHTLSHNVVSSGNQKPTIEGQIINTGNQKPTNEGQIINTNTITNKDKRKKNDRLNITQKI